MRQFFLALIVFAIGYTQVEARTYTFSLVPREIIMQCNKTTISLSLVLDGKKCDKSKAELQAICHNGSTRFVYSCALKALMKKLHLHKSDFAPFRDYLTWHIKKAKKHPAHYLDMLSKYLATGACPHFTVDIGE